jgi:hypothetical protein
LIERVPHSLIPSTAENVIHNVFQVPWVAVVFGQLGPVWAAIGAIFAIAGLMTHFRKIRVAGQLFSEIILCLIMLALFPID